MDYTGSVPVVAACRGTGEAARGRYRTWVATDGHRRAPPPRPDNSRRIPLGCGLIECVRRRRFDVTDRCTWTVIPRCVICPPPAPPQSHRSRPRRGDVTTRVGQSPGGCVWPAATEIASPAVFWAIVGFDER